MLAYAGIKSIKECKLPHNFAGDVVDALKFYREESGLTPLQLGRMAGISKQYVKMIEERRISPSKPALAAIAESLGLALHRLL